MKINIDYFVIPYACIAIYGLYEHYKTLKRLDAMEHDIETILKTHLVYMESLEKQYNDINDINNTIEQIALSLPFKGKGWQTKYVEAKVNREIEKHIANEEKEELKKSIGLSQDWDDGF